MGIEFVEISPKRLLTLFVFFHGKPGGLKGVKSVLNFKRSPLTDLRFVSETFILTTPISRNPLSYPVLTTLSG